MHNGQIFWTNIGIIRAALLLEENSFASYLGIGFHEFIKHKTKKEFLPFHSIITLGLRLSFDYNELFKENFDINKILDPLSSGKRLSERYTQGTYTRPIVILNTLRHIEFIQGVRAKAELLNGFNLDLYQLMRTDTRVNIHLNKDILSFLRARYKLDLNFFLQMGRTVAGRMTDSPMAEDIKTQKNIEQMLELFILEYISEFDENFHYTIKSLSSDFAVVEAVPRKNVLEELEILPTHFGNDPADFNRMGIFSSISFFNYGQFAEIKRISDLLIGDKSSQYLIDLRPFKS
jgi:hypothetical protein